LDRSDRSVEVALDYLRRVGVAWSAHPTQDEVRREYEMMWQQIGSRPIEALSTCADWPTRSGTRHGRPQRARDVALFTAGICTASSSGAW